MPPPTFTWIPSYSTAVTWEPKLLTITFGDGYDQQIPDGINNNRLKFNVIFDKISDDERAQIVQFIRALGGYLPFYWTPPAPYNDQGALLWKTATYSDTFEQANSDSLQLTFLQTFNPS